MTAVLYEVRDAVATITLNRPQALNALDQSMIEGLRAACDRAAYDPGVRAVLVRAAGDHFMAGGDLKWFREQFVLSPAERQACFSQVVASANASAELLRTMAKPVVAAVQGAAAGYGLSLMLSADLVLAADDAYFTTAYCKIGQSPDGGATWSLPRVVGLRRAMEIALLGDRFNAARAAELGIVNRVVPRAQLADEAAALARRLADGPTAALARTKALLNQSLTTPLSAQLAAEQQSFAACGAEPDFVEGLAAFFEKRPAAFSGRS
ncbi:enoyl-CoA hydratase/isomerase family protein [Rhodocyclus purpureus]|uniref:enoyl-CoA hydratase/isomerase family protein n=1 Tax=Rhodocyclus purpureus TaxID=1067 RepID=UPI001911D844|nr:enoyl-CoA hydratase-related protein [Rhodocyclus purpureus]MBK5913209.1 enoyl-CoA hydratase [Rhodocyclus purpureus]